MTIPLMVFNTNHIIPFPINQVDLPEALDMDGEDDDGESAYEKGLDGTAEPDDSSYDAPIIPLDD